MASPEGEDCFNQEQNLGSGELVLPFLREERPLSDSLDIVVESRQGEPVTVADSTSPRLQKWRGVLH